MFVLPEVRDYFYSFDERRVFNTKYKLTLDSSRPNSHSDLELSEETFNEATCLAIRAPDDFFFVN